MEFIIEQASGKTDEDGKAMIGTERLWHLFIESNESLKYVLTEALYTEYVRPIGIVTASG